MNIANLLSVVRLFMLPFFVAFGCYYSGGAEKFRYIALGLLVLSFITDGLDGFIARSRGITTKIGAFLDPLGDKLLINSAFLILILKPVFKDALNLPAWVVIVVFSRDFFIGLGSLILHMEGKLKILPSYLGKTAVVLQMASIVSGFLLFSFTQYIWHFTGLVTVLAGIGYFIREIRA
ncbi:MAG: CDP-alcohol phosphatidyltransferase family protein [Candidatus Omnitrophica bacterium]|nr:CDP-alcohol phosphatidyltransferase family protein [Candidatus Omnitrophota bacterium]